MAWKKIDDLQAQPDMPYSAFLANGLTTNANSYNQQLTRGGGIAWNAHDKVTWASYFTPQGLMFTVDVGQQVTQLDFRVKYATISAAADADGFQGIAFVTHLGSGEFVEVGVVPTTGALSYFDVSMPLNTAATGPQAFSLTFRSSKLGSKGNVDIQGGVENTIYLESHGGGGAYTITAGEKFELLSLAETGAVVNTTGPSTQDQQYYQINYVNTTGPHPPDAYASVVPPVTSNPPRLSPSYDNSKVNPTGTVFELGAFTLYSIAYNVVSANPGSAPPQYAHNSTTALSQVINIQNTGMRQFQMDLCNGVSQRYALGAVVAGAVTIPTAKPAQKLSFSFSCGAAVVESELCVTFSALTLSPIFPNQQIRLDLYDRFGTLLYNRTQTVYAPSDRTLQCVAGITARGWYDLSSAAKWGMRDSMPDQEMLAGSPQTFIIPSQTYARDLPYTIELSVVGNVTAFYLYNLYARFIVSAG